MKVLVIGATGFIGRNLVKRLLERNHEVYVLTRNAGRARNILGNRVHIRQGNTGESSIFGPFLQEAQAVINLAGENLASKRWSQKQKSKILTSRINTGEALSTAFTKMEDKPQVLIQASAIGYYGFSEHQVFTEQSPSGKGFLPALTRRWEESVGDIPQENIRTIYIRSGIVLGKEGGMLSRMLIPFRYFMGGSLGKGTQWLSWIHIDDESRAIVKLMETQGLSGAFNLTAPNPVTMKEFARTLGRVMNRPAWLTVPGFVLKVVFGDMARETMLQGQKVMPERLQELGFEYQYPSLENALKDLLKR